MSAPAAFQIGLPFNPWRGACGFYVPDLISRIGPMMIIGTRRKFSDPHKLLFTLLVRRSGKNGLCFPSIKKNLAPAMGHSERAIKIWIEDLEQFRLIARKRRGRGPGGKGLSNEYVFLWHPIYEVQSYPISKCKNQDYEVQRPDVSKCKDGCYEVQEPALPYKEETCSVETRTSETCSSSSSDAATEQPTETPKRKKFPLSSEGPKPKTGEAAWYEVPGMMEQAGAIIADSLPRFSPLQITGIEVPTVLAILRHMTDLDDLKLWLGSAPGLHASAKGWGRLVTDAAHWPARRNLTVAIVERSVPAPQERSFRNYEEPAPQQPAEPKPPEPSCELCERTGLCQSPDDPMLYAWCTCAFAAALRSKEPGQVDEANARVAMIREKFASPTGATA